MSLDFSTKLELHGLARVAGALQEVAAPLGVEFFLMGAAARDLMLRHAHGIERLLTILIPEADEAGPLLLAQQSGLHRERTRLLLEVLCDEPASAM